MSQNRPLQSQSLDPWALCTLDEAKYYLKLTSNLFDDKVELTINDVTGWIEERCKRVLKSRTFDGTGNNPAALILDGSGDSEIDVGEWPITAVTSVEYKSGDTGGTYTAMNITQWVETSNGSLFLPFDAFPEGQRNIRLKATIGYTATHVRQLRALRRACLRLVQVAWQDQDQGTGRGTGISIEGQSFQLVDEAIPKDVRDVLILFERIY